MQPAAADAADITPEYPLAPSLSSSGPRIRPRLSLGLLSVQHALIHGQSALYPLIYLAVIDEFGVTAATIVILSTVADGVLLVSRTGQTTRANLRETVRQIRDVNGRIIGCVLNDMDLEKGGYGDYRYRRYGSSVQAQCCVACAWRTHTHPTYATSHRGEHTPCTCHQWECPA